MSRITTKTGELVSEIISPKVVLEWDPITNGGSVVFHMERMVTLDGELISREPLNAMLYVAIEELLERSFTVPTGVDGSGNVLTTQVPTSLVMATIKTAFDQIYMEKMVTDQPEV